MIKEIMSIEEMRKLKSEFLEWSIEIDKVRIARNKRGIRQINEFYFNTSFEIDEVKERINKIVSDLAEENILLEEDIERTKSVLKEREEKGE